MGGVHHLAYEAGFLPRRHLASLTGVRPLPPPLTNNHFLSALFKGFVQRKKILSIQKFKIRGASPRPPPPSVLRFHRKILLLSIITSVLKCITDINTLIRASLLSLPSSLFLFPPPCNPPPISISYLLSLSTLCTYTLHTSLQLFLAIAIAT